VTAFLVIGAVGVVLLIVSLAVGEIFEGVFDALGGDLLSGASVAAFLGALGFVGAIVLEATGRTGWAIAAGLAAGLVVGALAGWLTLSLTRGGDDSTVRSGSLVGREATIVNAVPTDGYGEISVVASGHITKLNARSDRPLPAGTPVTITAVLSATSVQVAVRTPPEGDS
jgi:membrane protein implicated in regulation of membrane protease activity